LIGPWV